MKEKTLDEMRREIDAIDDRILDCLNRRAALVIEVGQLKAKKNQEFFVPSRERAIYDRLSPRETRDLFPTAAFAMSIVRLFPPPSPLSIP